MPKLITKYNWTSVGLFVGFIIIAHFFITSPYDWRTNTISELASQHYQYRMIMKTGFILFGGILAIGTKAKTAIMAISNCLFSPSSENPRRFSVWCVLVKLRAKPRNYS
ncbi:MAG: hypothetical protein KDE33_09360 [Bacteroidetes bacterium]|nr:hypothetical protein [Bacteroidota bacterium]